MLTFAGFWVKAIWEGFALLLQFFCKSETYFKTKKLKFENAKVHEEHKMVILHIHHQRIFLGCGSLQKPQGLWMNSYQRHSRYFKNQCWKPMTKALNPSFHVLTTCEMGNLWRSSLEKLPKACLISSFTAQCNLCGSWNPTYLPDTTGSKRK